MLYDLWAFPATASQLITISYVSAPCSTGKTWDAMDLKAKELFRGKGKYLVVRNNSRGFNAPDGRISASPGTSPIAAEHSVFDDDENAVGISVYSHGRNDLMDIHNKLSGSSHAPKSARRSLT
jgi:hypothetical protein